MARPRHCVAAGPRSVARLVEEGVAAIKTWSEKDHKSAIVGRLLDISITNTDVSRVWKY